MSANVFGNLFQVMTFGESHGPGLGAVIDGCPAGVAFDSELLTQNLRRRRPGQSAITTSRREEDHPEILSGVFEGKTLGTPIAIVVRNKNQDSAAYTSEVLKTRPGHATDLWQSKFGHSDPRGSGRASGRETLSRVLGGSVAQMVLQNLFPELKVLGFVPLIQTLNQILGSYYYSRNEVKSFSKKGILASIFSITLLYIMFVHLNEYFEGDFSLLLAISYLGGQIIRFIILFSGIKLKFILSKNE